MDRSTRQWLVNGQARDVPKDRNRVDYSRSGVDANSRDGSCMDWHSSVARTIEGRKMIRCVELGGWVLGMETAKPGSDPRSRIGRR